MRLLICGGRHFDETATILDELNRLHAHRPITVLIHGGLPLIGTPAEAWARQNDVHVIRYPANWTLLGKQADTRRNLFMLEDSRPDMLLAFPGGRHTTDMLLRARSINVPVIVAKATSRDAETSDSSMASDCVDDPEGDKRWCMTPRSGTAVAAFH
ncbi:hypothetical protein M2281_005584 [Mesorhizobium soli]|uniref:DUF2493 domain-containing protein n=1 Tax=Pseudaminobacter soli (ex Li et al. 2025) TaxID=1295366 RepID=UPI00247552F7|nr:DUF2493 domain-containing protein [Mesorhizobium soli]MDH6234963.1 hypothetical protein [Mesorhizobium soli]